MAIKDKMTKRLFNQLERYRNQVAKFNEELEEFYIKTDDNKLPIIDSTIIGFEELPLAVITEIGYFDNEDKYGFQVEWETETYEVCIISDEDDRNILYVDGWDNWLDGLYETLKYNKRRLKKAIRIWESENPDAELEKEDDEEYNIDD